MNLFKDLDQFAKNEENKSIREEYNQKLENCSNSFERDMLNWDYSMKIMSEDLKKKRKENTSSDINIIETMQKRGMSYEEVAKVVDIGILNRIKSETIEADIMQEINQNRNIEEAILKALNLQGINLDMKKITNHFKDTEESKKKQFMSVIE